MTVLRLAADRSYEVAIFFLRWGEDEDRLRKLFPDLSDIEIRCGADIANRLERAGKHLDDVVNEFRKKKRPEPPVRDVQHG